MKRDAGNKMLSWKNRKERKPLVLMGAPRIHAFSEAVP